MASSSTSCFVYGEKETHRRAFPDKAVPMISYGLRFPEACAHHVQASFRSASRIYIIASGSLSRNTDALRRLQEALGSRVVGTRVGMQPHTLWSEVLSIAAEARALPGGVDLLVTLGAGSLTDGAKWVALALANRVDHVDGLWAMCVQNPAMRRRPAEEPAEEAVKTVPSAIPIIAIPTSLSGGEYQARGGATEDATRKKRTIQPPQMPIRGPTLVILDPELAATTPQWVWLSTGVRAVDHCVETLCSLRSNPDADDAAERGLAVLVPGLLRCKKGHEEEEEKEEEEEEEQPRAKKEEDLMHARHACQMGVIDAMAACSNGVPMGASHGIGHQLGPLGVGHGETSCILLPAVCKFNKSKGGGGGEIAARQQRPRDVLLRDPRVRDLLRRRGVADHVDTVDLADILDAVIRELGMPRSLKEKGVVLEDQAQLEDLAEKCLEDTWLRTNPFPLTRKEDVLQVLEMVL